ncbi:MAG: hypothetical protein ACYCVY_00370 [Acidiferrobacteraceae bacterium]
MGMIIEISGKPVEIDWSTAARRMLEQREQPLRVEMELYFSCLIRKRVRFDEQVRSRSFVAAGTYLEVAFRPVMTRACQMSDYDEVPLTDFPIVNPTAFIPHWLRIDFRRQAWRGTFGFTEQALRVP